MPLFDIPKEVNKAVDTNKSKSKVKLKKGQTLTDLIDQAEKLVNEKLAKYKDVSKCVTDVNDLVNFFNSTPEGGVIRNRYRNYRLKYFSR